MFVFGLRFQGWIETRGSDQSLGGGGIGSDLMDLRGFSTDGKRVFSFLVFLSGLKVSKLKSVAF